MILRDRERKLLALLDRSYPEPVLIAGILECRTALDLIDLGLIRLVDGGLADDGGSGRVARLDPPTQPN